MKHYFVFITLFLPNYVNDIIAGMIKKQYTIMKATENGDIVVTQDACTLLIFKILNVTIKNNPSNKISKDLFSVLEDCDAKYYSFLITECGDAEFKLGNVVLPDNTLPLKNISD